MLATLLALGSVPFLSASSASAAGCDRVASTTGSDTAAGTVSAPYRTAQKLVSSLSAGETGCLRDGEYAEDVTIRRAGITLTSYPGERGTVRGYFRSMDGADDVTITGIVIDGRNASRHPSPLILGNRVTLSYNEITTHNDGICLTIGAYNWATIVAQDVTVAHNRIHNCGRLPSNNQEHGIYVQNTTGLRIVDNVIYDNADRGIQLYPHSIGTVVSGNVVDGNGEGLIFSSDYGAASSNNVVEHNIFSNSNIRADIEAWWASGSPVGTGNVARNNCVWGPRTIDLSNGGFSVLGNLVADPFYADRAAKDFRLRPGGLCSNVLGDADPPLAPGFPGGDTSGLVAPAPVPPPAPAPDPIVQIVEAGATPTAPGIVAVSGVVAITPAAGSGQAGGSTPAATQPVVEVQTPSGSWVPATVTWTPVKSKAKRPAAKPAKPTARKTAKRSFAGKVRIRGSSSRRRLKLRVRVGHASALRRVVLHG